MEENIKNLELSKKTLHSVLARVGRGISSFREEISLLARILCVADIFDALITDRPYRKAFTIEEARQELIKMKGKLDPKVVDAFLETF